MEAGCDCPYLPTEDMGKLERERERERKREIASSHVSCMNDCCLCWAVLLACVCVCEECTLLSARLWMERVKEGVRRGCEMREKSEFHDAYQTQAANSRARVARQTFFDQTAMASDGERTTDRTMNETTRRAVQRQKQERERAVCRLMTANDVSMQIFAPHLPLSIPLPFQVPFCISLANSIPHSIPLPSLLSLPHPFSFIAF